ncbi:hypothetical protein CSIM01_05283 [Colletotrichum simmondsii]|uniref:Uncharacterized protein n=1 Tax=Colletotrichum simmondsii TaxID=703756 RepID=A0A135TGN8_9PEZI|nr:hypothetical protein CSIM01_05283 [Colletotrichum simmondsii]
MDLHNLSSIGSPDKDRKLAWLIDGQLVDGEIRFRKCLGSLTAGQLTEALLEPRYRVPLLTGNEKEDNCQETISLEDSLTCDAERRLLTSIGVAFASHGPQIFSLEFHLPFRVWRITKGLLKDERVKKSDNKALRSSRNVTYLMPPAENGEETQVHGIYSGHVACLVSGYDYWRWTAHFAIDTWFDEDEGINDQVTRYDNDREDGFEWDPCSGGQDDARRPLWYPRVWFLRIFGIRLDQIKDEWESIALHLGQSIDREDSKHQNLLHEARVSPGSAVSEQQHLTDTLETTMLESRGILQDLLSDLHELVKVGASFMSTEVNFFLNNDGQPGQAAECYPYLTEIRGRFNDLGQLSFRLENYQARCTFLIEHCESSKKNALQNFSPILEKRIAESSLGVLRMQVEMEKLRNEYLQLKLRNDQLLAIGPGDVEEVRVLAFSTLLTQAFSQTTALFSADGVIAFTKNWQSFLLSLLVAYGINITIGAAFLAWIRRDRRVVQNALHTGQMVSVAPPAQILSNSSAVALRSTGEAVTEGFTAHTSSTSSSEGGLTFYFRRRLSDRLWLSYRQPERVNDAELGNPNASITEELT